MQAAIEFMQSAYRGLSHSREGGNPVINDSVHPEFVEGFLTKEWFDRLTMIVSDWIPAFAGMTHNAVAIYKIIPVKTCVVTLHQEKEPKHLQYSYRQHAWRRLQLINHRLRDIAAIHINQCIRKITARLIKQISNIQLGSCQRR